MGIMQANRERPHAGAIKDLDCRLRPRASSWAAQSYNHCLPATAWVQAVSLLVCHDKVNEQLQRNECH